MAGLVQVAVGITMYLAGVYFASWSMLVSVAVRLSAASSRGYSLDNRQLPHESFAVLRAGLSAPLITIRNLIRLTVIDTVLSAIAAGPLRTCKSSPSTHTREIA